MPRMRALAVLLSTRLLQLLLRAISYAPNDITMSGCGTLDVRLYIVKETASRLLCARQTTYASSNPTYSLVHLNLANAIGQLNRLKLILYLIIYFQT